MADHQERVERIKLLYDLSKHITTLSTGTLLLMAGLLDKIFKSPTWKFLAILAFLSFASCLIMALFSMLGYSVSSRSSYRKPGNPADFGFKTFVYSLLCYIIGVLFFTVFVARNLL